MTNIKIGGFEPLSLYAKSLIPILDALEWNGSNIDLIEALVDDASNMDKNGLIETLANLKYRSTVTKVPKLENHKEFYPCLYIKKKTIYVVVTKKESTFLVYDCSDSTYKKLNVLKKGRKIILFSNFDSVDSNLLKPQKNWFFNLLTRFKKEFSYILLISLFITLLSFITPLFIMLIHSQVRTSQNWINIAYLGVAAFIFILSVAGFKYIRSYLLSYLSSRIGNLVSKEIFRRIIYLPPKFLDTASIRSQLTRIKDFESITEFFSGTALVSLIDIPLSLLLIIGLVFIGGNIVFVPLTAYVIMLLVGLFAYKAFQNINKIDVGSVNEKNIIQSEMLNKMSEIRLTGNMNRWFDKFTKYYAESIYISNRSSNFLLIINTLSKSIVNITLVLSISVSVSKVISGGMSSSALFSSFIIISRIMSPLRSGFSTMSQLSKIKKSIEQLNKFMNLQIEDRPTSITTIQSKLDGDINFNNIFLKYGTEIQPALINLKFKIHQNETTVITGHDGCGKSSLVKVLLGLYTPLSGTITIDNINIMQLDKIELRKSISYIPAEPYLFPGSLKFNLYLCKPNATDNQLLHAMELAGIKDDILALKKGLATNINELPERMKQANFIKKINLASMLLRGSSLYIIDGIEVGLDSSDYNFFKNLIISLEGSATIIITTASSEFIDLGRNVMTMDSGRIINYELNYKVGINE